MTSTYKFTLASIYGDKLTRSVVYVSNLTKHVVKGQTTSNTSVKSYSEKVTMADKTTFTLDDYQFSQGSVIDNRPANDYYSGNIIARKIYLMTTKTKNAIKEEITVHITGESVGFTKTFGDL